MWLGEGAIWVFSFAILPGIWYHTVVHVLRIIGWGAKYLLTRHHSI